MKKSIVIAVIAALASSHVVSAQIIEEPSTEVGGEINVDSLRREFDSGPYYSLYKDNYFIFGPSFKNADKQNTNVKFQVSVQVKLTKTVLPFHSYLYFYYTQKVVWNILEKSAPMRDLNFNPGVGFARPFFMDDRYFGKVSIQVEHESNGRDSIQSRSWNRVTLGANAILNNNVMVYGKAWIPFALGQQNRDITRYCGIFQVGAQLMSRDRRWIASATLVKRRYWRMNFNTIAELSWRFSRDSDWCLFAQYYNGYGENLLDFNQFRTQLRVGIVLRPALFSDF